MPTMGDDFIATGLSGDLVERNFDLVAGNTFTAVHYVLGRDWTVSVVGGNPSISSPIYTSNTMNLNTPVIFTNDKPFTIIGSNYSEGGADDGIMVMGRYAGTGGVRNRRGIAFYFYHDTGNFALGGSFAKNVGVVTTAFTSDGGGIGACNVLAHQYETNETLTKSAVSTASTFIEQSQSQDQSLGKYYWACWDRQLSVTEIREFSKNPYQFLIPA